MSTKEKIAVVCTVVAIAIMSHFLYRDYVECQREWHRGCAPEVGSGPISK